MARIKSSILPIIDKKQVRISADYLATLNERFNVSKRKSDMLLKLLMEHLNTPGHAISNFPCPKNASQKLLSEVISNNQNLIASKINLHLRHFHNLIVKKTMGMLELGEVPPNHLLTASNEILKSASTHELIEPSILETHSNVISFSISDTNPLEIKSDVLHENNIINSHILN